MRSAGSGQGRQPDAAHVVCVGLLLQKPLAREQLVVGLPRVAEGCTCSFCLSRLRESSWMKNVMYKSRNRMHVCKSMLRHVPHR